MAGWLGALGLLVAVGGRRWGQQGGLPAGPDGGQWLALGRGLFGGEGRSAAGAYPPLVPAAVEGVGRMVGPLDGLRVVAVGSLLAVVAAYLLVARGALGWGIGLAAAATLAGATALAEPMAFGGYPQQTGFAALLVSAWWLARFLTGGGRWDLVGVSAALGCTALAHHVYFPLALVVGGAVWVGWLGTRPPRGVVGRRTLGAGVAGGVGVACFLPTALAFRAAGYAAPLDAAGFGLAAAFRYGTREWPGLWAAVIALGMIGFGVAFRRRGEPGWLVGVALAGVTGVAFGFSGEPRLLPPLLAGGLLGVGFGLRWLWERADGAYPHVPSRTPERSSEGGSRSGPHPHPLSRARERGAAPSPASKAAVGGGGRKWGAEGPEPSHGVGMSTARALARAVVVAVGVVLPVIVWGRADRHVADFFRYYRVVDGSLLGAAAAVEAGDDGGLVVVRHDRRGWPLGWWFEGLTEAPIVVGSDPRWLGFPEERAGAALAGRFFDRPLTGPEVGALARETGVGRLVFRKREWIGWQRWLGEPEPAVRVVYDDGVFMVVEMGG